jgi:integrase/recombinase XerC
VIGAWEVALAGFEAHLRGSTSRKWATSKQYVQHVGWLAEGVATGPWEVSSSDLGSWLARQNWSVATSRNVMVSLRVFYAWAVGEGFLQWAPTAGATSAARRPGPAARPWPAAWSSAVVEFVQALRSANRSETTIRSYLERLRLLSEVSADPWNVTPAQLEQLLSNPEWKPNYRRSMRTAVASFYKWAQRRGHVEVSPALDLPQVRAPRSLPRPAPYDVVLEALAAADDRTRLALLLAVDGGLRRAEIAGLHFSQVNDTHLLVVGKGGVHRMVPMDPAGELATALRVELERRRDGRHGTGWSGPFVKANGYVFPSDMDPGPITPQRIGNLIARALPAEWTAHPLRHRFATDAYAVERDLQAVQQLLGHSKPETTAVYAQVPDGAMLTAVVSAGRRRREVLGLV